MRRESRTAGSLSQGALEVLDACDTRSVAEVSAAVHMPIGVVRVLLGDLMEQGLVQVQATITERSSRDERIELMVVPAVLVATMTAQYNGGIYFLVVNCNMTVTKKKAKKISVLIP